MKRGKNNMLTSVLLSALIATCFSWNLQSTHTEVIVNITNDVSLHCHYDVVNQGEQSGFGQLIRIRILKESIFGTWINFAEVSLPDITNITLRDAKVPGFTAVGHLGKPSESFLLVTWETASDETVGTYACEVDGFVEKIRNDVHAKTNIITINSTLPTTTDLVDIILTMRRNARRTSEDMKAMSGRMLEILENMKKEFEIKNNQQKTVILREVQARMKEQFFEARFWPSGEYSLLAPASGCPDTPYQRLAEGVANIISDGSEKAHHEFPTHLYSYELKPCDSHNISLRFCVNGDGMAKAGVPWPRGKYCMHRYHGSFCPPGFDLGNIRAYLKSSSSLVMTKDDVIADTVHVTKKELRLRFCCRDDGDPAVPMILPSSKPFYLLRYKGQCQKVFNMNVTEESLLLDTDEKAVDEYYKTFYPDNTLNPVRIKLCYYTRSELIHEE